MSIEDPSFGPLQIVIVGFDTTARCQSEVARELLEFALEDLRRLIDEIGPGDHAVDSRRASLGVAAARGGREAGGRLVGQGFLTPEVTMVVGAEIRARADAEAAIELPTPPAARRWSMLFRS